MTINFNHNTTLLLFSIAGGLILTLIILVMVLFRKINKKATREDLEGQVNLLRNETNQIFNVIGKRLDSQWQHALLLGKEVEEEEATRLKDNKELLGVINNDRKELLGIVNKLSAQLFNVEQIQILNSQNIRKLQNIVPEVKQEVVIETEPEKEFLPELVNLSMEEILEISKSKYSIGDKVRCNFVGSPYEGILSTSPEINNSTNIIFCNIKDSPLNMVIYHMGQWAEIVTKVEQTEPTDEDLLARAKRDYPVGTKFVSLASKKTNVSEGNIMFNIGIYKHDIIDDGNGCIYDASKKEWAEIIPAEIKEEPKKSYKEKRSNVHYVKESGLDFSTKFATSCGRYNTDYKKGLYYSFKISEVTCKNCLKSLNANK